MFTGIISEIGTITHSAPDEESEGRRITIDCGADWLADVRPGDSIAVAGICLTAVRVANEGSFDAQLSPETMSRSDPELWRTGRRVNLERALAAGDVLGGHIVTGHVDGLGDVRSVDRDSGYHLAIKVADSLRDFIAQKGSVTIDGTSLTVSDTSPDGFRVVLVPHTLSHSTLSELAKGDRVHVEVDIIARYCVNYLRRQSHDS